MLSPESIAEYLGKAKSTTEEKRRLIETLSKERERVKTEADKMFSLYMADGISKDLFKERYQPLEERKKQIEEELPKAEAELSLLEVDTLSSEYIIEEARDVKASWPTMTPAEKRRIVESLVDRITIGKEEIDISLCYLPSFREMTNSQRILKDALPICKVTLHRVRCLITPYFTEVKGYPTSPKSIGEMIRKRRLDLGLRQEDVAKIAGCDTTTVTNWEKGHATPRVNHMAKVVQFLGFNPFQNGDTLAQRLVNHRNALGTTQKEFARQIGVDPSTLAKWERGKREPLGLFLSRLLVAMDAKTPISNTSIKTPAIQVPQDGWGQRLLEHRTARHLSQRQFAARIGVAQTTIARWESGEHYPTGLWLKALAAELAVSQ